MNLRRHLGLVITGSILLVLGIFLVVMLVRFQSSYQQVRQDLKTTVNRLNQLYGRDPYPSEENVQLVQSNLVALTQNYEELVSVLKLGQVDPVNMEPAEFPLLLDRTIRRLRDRAREHGVRLPPRFAFGFERYALGALPNHEDVSRLVMQVQTLEKLCEAVFRSKVFEMENIERTVFERGVIEQTGAAREGRRRLAMDIPDVDPEPAKAEWVDPGGMFAREAYKMTFRAMDSAVWTALNDLAKMGLFTVVARVELVNPAPLPKPTKTPRSIAESPTPESAPALMDMFAAAGQTAPVEPKAKIEPHESRVVAGREQVKAVVEVHVYRFLDGKQQENQQ